MISRGLPEAGPHPPSVGTLINIKHSELLGARQRPWISVIRHVIIGRHYHHMLCEIIITDMQ